MVSANTMSSKGKATNLKAIQDVGKIWMCLLEFI